MGSFHNDLNELIVRLTDYLDQKDEKLEASTKVIEVADSLAEAASGSWLGYQSCVYYEHFETPPPGASFSRDWGLRDFYGQGSSGAWCEYAFNDVVALIFSEAGDPNLEPAESFSRLGTKLLSEAKSAAVVELRVFLNEKPDTFVEDLLSKIEDIKVLGADDFVKLMMPKGRFQTRDARAADGGLKTPPHVSVAAQCLAYGLPAQAISELLESLKKATAYMTRSRKAMVKEKLVGTNVFIGHGRSSAWRDVKDFISDRLRLPYDEFNRVPVAGFTNITRLSEMLDSAAIAFLIMTAEDEQADGSFEARTNVVHEVGLFQGRLGFSRAIILLEEGCKDFSNIDGLGQIRFPKGNVKAVFEEVRRVLEREKIIPSQD
ncbi:nucleotide-binding protein [Pseudomonas protegens]|uniref:TIR domain-containing protein n=1 Tax=Pseudomonas protegens TaxID=380021 RepID=UPI002023CBBF|nr:TIR domain-containing protein [Pseudomonas protegens]MCL9654730.1 nucleotide-binding protein [Pseudomonas protegens]